MRPALWEPRCDTIADHDTVVYETDDSEDLPDAARFETSVNASSCVSIGFDRMLCSSPSDLPEGEASDIVTDMGMDAPPITLYQDIPVVVGEHPSDQDLVNYLDRIFDFICGNIGNRTSLNRIFESMHKEDPSINRNSVYDYVPYLEEACLIEHVKEMDLRGRSILTSSYKYYLSDIGLRNARLGFRSDEIAGTMENILYLELRSRGYEVYVGNNNGKEIDLVGILNGRRIYIQACVRLSSDSVIEREHGNFKGIEDNWPKYVVVLENSMLDSDLDGIRTMSLEEFLLSDDY